jgi:sarcosine oxidase, subunit gamma
MTRALYRSPLAALVPDGRTVRGLAFTDLTLARRAGVKGPRTRQWLGDMGYRPLPPPNFAIRSSSGPLVVMLGESEALLLDAASRAALWSFGSGAAISPGVYPVARSEGSFWVAISGRTAPDMFACVCSVDLRPGSFRDLQVAQTMIAKASAIIIRDDAFGDPTFHVLGDISLAPYLVGELLTAAQSA